MAKKDEAKKDGAEGGFAMPDMSKVMEMAKSAGSMAVSAASFVGTHVMSLVNMCKEKCCAAKEAKADKKAKK